MRKQELIARNLESECVFTTSRSSGPGGQNVNKVNTRVELRFNIHVTEKLSEKEKMPVLNKLRNRINSEGELIIVSQSERTQLKNREKVIERFYYLLSSALTIKRFRVPTSPTLKSKKERLESKKKRSAVKETRKGFRSKPEE